MAISQKRADVVERLGLKSTDLDLVERILLYLYAYGESTLGTISKNTRVSADKCAKYLECLTGAELTTRDRNEQASIFGLTPVGISFCKGMVGFLPTR